MSRVGIVGGPRTGKSTLARRMSATAERPCPILCTDPRGLVKDVEVGVEYVPNQFAEWSAASQYVAEVFLVRPGPWVLDGVGLPRALRKWRTLHPGKAPPLDKLIVLTVARRELLPGQDRMTKGVMSVLGELDDWLAGIIEWRGDGVCLADEPRAPRPRPASTPTGSGLRIYRDTRGLEVF